jgi:ABC-2 type transport system ATP-binding protein
VSYRIVDVRDLRKQFDDKEAVTGLTFHVEEGEIVGLLGPNGAGKTTAIHILLGLTTATSGSAEIFGLDHRTNRREILRRSNFSSAYTNLPANLRVWENLHISSLLYDVPNSAEKAERLLELFEITDLRNRISGHLSSGEATRLNLCKALLNDPELLLLDEPTASLDPDIADKVRKTLRRLQRERRISMIYTSHNMRDVEEVCDRVYFMNRGKIIAEGTPDEVIKQFHESSLENVFINVARGGELVSGEVKRGT